MINEFIDGSVRDHQSAKQSSTLNDYHFIGPGGRHVGLKNKLIEEKVRRVLETVQNFQRNHATPDLRGGSLEDAASQANQVHRRRAHNCYTQQGQRDRLDASERCSRSDFFRQRPSLQPRLHRHYNHGLLQKLFKKKAFAKKDLSLEASRNSRASLSQTQSITVANINPYLTQSVHPQEYDLQASSMPSALDGDHVQSRMDDNLDIRHSFGVKNSVDSTRGLEKARYAPYLTNTSQQRLSQRAQDFQEYMAT